MNRASVKAIECETMYGTKYPAIAVTVGRDTAVLGPAQVMQFIKDITEAQIEAQKMASKIFRGE